MQFGIGLLLLSPSFPLQSFPGSPSHRCWCRAQHVWQSIRKKSIFHHFDTSFYQWDIMLCQFMKWTDHENSTLEMGSIILSILMFNSFSILGSLLCSVPHPNEWIPGPCYIGQYDSSRYGMVKPYISVLASVLSNYCLVSARCNKEVWTAYWYLCEGSGHDWSKAFSTQPS